MLPNRKELMDAGVVSASMLGIGMWSSKFAELTMLSKLTDKITNDTAKSLVNQGALSIAATAAVGWVGGQKWAKRVMFGGILSMAQTVFVKYLINSGVLGEPTKASWAEYNKGLNGFGDYVTMGGMGSYVTHGGMGDYLAYGDLPSSSVMNQVGMPMGDVDTADPDYTGYGVVAF
jgi:hypothetical protein